MSGITKWIISIFAVIIIGVVVDLLFSGSRMAKMMRCVTATVTLLIIVMPLPVMLKNGFDINQSSVFEYSPQLDEGYLNYVNKSKIRVLEKSAEKALDEAGIKNADVVITAEIKDDEINFVQVVINSDKSVIDEKLEHINKNELAIQTVAKLLKVDESKVSVNG